MAKATSGEQYSVVCCRRGGAVGVFIGGSPPTVAPPVAPNLLAALLSLEPNLSFQNAHEGH